MADYKSICGLDDDGSEELNKNNKLSDGSTKIANDFIRRYVLGALYFCNQRPGIFIAPFLLVRGWRESRIGIVLFISGIVGLLAQAPAGELTDETPYKRTIVWFSNLLTIIGCICLLYSESYSVIVFAVSATVVSDAFSFPALYSITLGLVGPKGISDQVPFNESLTHCGNAFFAIISGLLVAFSDGGMAIFWICITMRILSSMIVFFIQNNQVDAKRARGLEDSDGTVASAPITYWELFTDYHVFVYLLSIFFFHFSNAAMLPLLSQKLFIDNHDLGFEFAALAVIIAQVSMVGSAIIAGILVLYYGTKPIFLTAISFIPIRGVIIVWLLKYYPNNILLLFTQVLDGMAGGAVGVLTVLIAENLSRGSGRFALLIGLARTGDAVGASFSNLFGEMIAEHAGYISAFMFLSCAALIPLLIYGLLMPSAKYNSDGTAIDELSISQRNKLNLSQHKLTNSNHSDNNSYGNGNLNGSNNGKILSNNNNNNNTTTMSSIHQLSESSTNSLVKNTSLHNNYRDDNDSHTIILNPVLQSSISSIHSINKHQSIEPEVSANKSKRINYDMNNML